ncbi:MAG: nicotinate-nucleotide adenylyltransferase [Lentisphaerota bacterium]
MSKKIGVLGGSFNPVHVGHLILAHDAMEAFGLDQVLLIPCAIPPHKNPLGLTSAQHRLAMLQRAVEEDSRLSVSTLELDRVGISYSVETLNDLVRLNPGTRYFFIIGADTLTELHTWRSIHEFLALCEVVTMRRPGYPWDLKPSDLKLEAPWPEKLLAHVFTGHAIGLSSSEIRRRVAEGLSIRYLVSRSVERYIDENKLYRQRAV